MSKFTQRSMATSTHAHAEHFSTLIESACVFCKEKKLKVCEHRTPSACTLTLCTSAIEDFMHAGTVRERKGYALSQTLTPVANYLGGEYSAWNMRFSPKDSQRDVDDLHGRVQHLRDVLRQSQATVTAPTTDAPGPLNESPRTALSSEEEARSNRPRLSKFTGLGSAFRQVSSSTSPICN
jgi:hypothetical protein